MVHWNWFFGFVAVCASVAFALWRWKKNHQALRLCLDLLPPSNQLTLSLVPDLDRKLLALATKRLSLVATTRSQSCEAPIAEGTAPDRLWNPLTSASIVDGALAGLPVLHAVSSIDPTVLHAIRASTAEHIHSFPSVHSYIEEHFFASPALSADGWFERLTGYVAEQKAAVALEATGHHVAFAATANQPAWDLLVDGHPVQIKEGLSGVRSFLLEHHGIPVFTGPEVASAVHDPLVHGLQGLDSESVHSVTRSSLEGVSDSFDPSFHFPIVTLGFSCFREARLLIGKRTTFLKATKNVGTDVGSVGAGAFGGAKAGAVAGAVFGPPGAAIGSLLGAILGGIGGKRFSTRIRSASFVAAKTNYEEAVVCAQRKVEFAVATSKEGVKQLQLELQATFNERRFRILHKAQGQIAASIKPYEDYLLLFTRRFDGYLVALLHALDQEVEEALHKVSGSWVLFRILRPSSNDHLRSALKAWHQRTTETIMVERQLIQQLVDSDVYGARAEIGRFLASHSFRLDSLDSELESLVESFCATKEVADKIGDEAANEVLRERESLLSDLSRRIQRVHSSLVEAIQSSSSSLVPVRERYVAEGRSIGLDLD